MAEVFRSGKATGILDQDEVIAFGDKVTNGAVSTFLQAAHRQLDPTIEEGRTLWPRDTGRSARSWLIQDRITADTVSAVATNTESYSVYVKFSTRLKKDLDAEARRWGDGKINPGERGLYVKLVNRLTRKLGRRPRPGEIMRARGAQLRKYHGEGAPNERVAGKGAFSWLIRRRVNQREQAVIDESREALDTLAQG